MGAGPVTWFVGLSAKWKCEYPLLKNYFRFQDGDSRALKPAQSSSELDALSSCTVTFMRVALVQRESQFRMGSFPSLCFFSPSHLGLSQRTAFNCPSPNNCLLPFHIWDYLEATRILWCQVAYIANESSKSWWKSSEGGLGETASRLPIKAALLTLR